MTPRASFESVGDRDLLLEVKRLAEQEREVTATLIAVLAEVDTRRLFLGEGCASLFVYCTRVLGFQSRRPMPGSPPRGRGAGFL